jgi:hypothetical protein
MNADPETTTAEAWPPKGAEGAKRARDTPVFPIFLVM